MLAEKFQFGSVVTESVDSSSGASKAYNSVENREEISEDDPHESTEELQDGDKKVIRQIACVVDHTHKSGLGGPSGVAWHDSRSKWYGFSDNGP